MTNNSESIVVTESLCSACDVHTVEIYHENFPELRVEGMSAEQAANHLADRLEAALDNVSDLLHRKSVHLALVDLRAFLDREGAVDPARDVSGTNTRRGDT
jgi:hypothetical protein